MMNMAHKRTWYCFLISFATILISAVVTAYIWRKGIDIFDFKRPTLYIILGLLNTIPLILVVIISARFPGKAYDERDLAIERKSFVTGGLGVMFFSGGLSLLLCIANPMGSIRTVLLPWFFYLTYFMGLMISSLVALFQYGWSQDNDGK